MHYSQFTGNPLPAYIQIDETRFVKKSNLQGLHVFPAVKFLNMDSFEIKVVPGDQKLESLLGTTLKYHDAQTRWILSRIRILQPTGISTQCNRSENKLVHAKIPAAVTKSFALKMTAPDTKSCSSSQDSSSAISGNMRSGGYAVLLPMNIKL